MKSFLKYYLPAIFWMLVIFGFSTIPGGGEYYPETAKQVFTRKGAHFVEFSILTFLFWRIFYSANKLSWQMAYFFTFILSAFYGASDEWHQTFVFGRTGKIIDAIFDGVSSILFLEIILIYIKKRIGWKNGLVLFFSFLTLVGLELKMIKTQNNTKKIQQNETEIINEQKNTELNTRNNTELKIQNSTEIDTQNNTELKTQNDIEIKIPDKFFIPVPFTSQAPFKIWDEIHEEACEEASIIMLKYFFDKKKITPEIAEREIQALVKLQNKKFGDFKDTTAKETADLFLDFYGELPDGKKLKVVYDFSKNDLKKYISKNYPIIIPAAGRELGNPNFTAPGPLYHNLVLVGYDGDTIITNDPGTKKGESYRYNIDILYNAIHDFTGKPEDILQGKKAMVVVE